MIVSAVAVSNYGRFMQYYATVWCKFLTVENFDESGLGKI